MNVHGIIAPNYYLGFLNICFCKLIFFSNNVRINGCCNALKFFYYDEEKLAKKAATKTNCTVFRCFFVAKCKLYALQYFPPVSSVLSLVETQSRVISSFQEFKSLQL